MGFVRPTRQWLTHGAALIVLLATPALAVDGVIEINQAKALVGGVTSGDTAGFPVKITAPGSYRLTGGLDLTGQPNPADLTAIEISASNVSIDLNGFTILGPANCTGSPASCTSTGGGYGIYQWSPHGNLTVTNGTVRGMGSDGIITIEGPGARIQGVRAIGNGGTGIQTSENSTVEDNTVQFNGGDGIEAGSGSRVRRNAVTGNGGYGIVNYSGGVNVDENVVDANGEDGIRIWSGLASRNAVRGSGSVGIRIQAAGSAIDNVSEQNVADGIVAWEDVTIRNNTVAGNTGQGLDLGAGGGYGNNVINGNTGGTVSGGVEIGTNLCNGTTTCP